MISDNPQPGFLKRLEEYCRLLCHADWQDPDGPLRLKRGLSIEDLQDAEFFQNTRQFLLAWNYSNQPQRTEQFRPALIRSVFRDEKDARMLLRVLFREGNGAIQSASCAFSGHACDPCACGLRDADSEVTAKPGDDLAAAAAIYGRVNLAGETLAPIPR